MADPAIESILISKIQVGAYNIIRKQLATETSFSQLADSQRTTRTNQRPNKRYHADELIECYITRLMWREFANSMKE